MKSVRVGVSNIGGPRRSHRETIRSSFSSFCPIACSRRFPVLPSPLGSMTRKFVVRSPPSPSRSPPARSMMHRSLPLASSSVLVTLMKRGPPVDHAERAEPRRASASKQVLAALATKSRRDGDSSRRVNARRSRGIKRTRNTGGCARSRRVAPAKGVKFESRERERPASRRKSCHSRCRLPRVGRRCK